MKTNEKTKIERTIVDNGIERPKTIHDYMGEELDQLREEDCEYENQLWADAAVEALNDPDNHK